MSLVDTANSQPVVPALRRVQHPKRIIGFGLVTALMVVGAFLGGSMVRSPQDQALKNVDTRVEVLAQVEERVVSNSFSLPAVTVAGATVDVLALEAPYEASSSPPPSAGTSPTPAPSAPQVEPAATERAVVSLMAVRVNTTLNYGSLIGEVSGRPVFAWPSTVPLFRDITVGSRGSDVRAVQQALADIGYTINVDGIFGRSSLETLGAFYAGAGYELPFVTAGIRGLSWREFVGVPTGDGAVEFTAPVGSLLTAEAPLLRVRTTAPSFESQATSVELDQLTVGAEVGVVVSGADPVRSTVISVGAFATDEDTGASGYPIRVAIPDGITADASIPVQIRPWAQPAPTTAVPTVALRQEGAASFVLLSSPASGKDEDFARVDVVVIAQADGWVAIEPNEKLPAGAEVLVSP